MATFSPPTADSIPPVYLAPDRYRPVPKISQRLFRYYPARSRGINLYKLANGSYTTTPPSPLLDASVVPASEANVVQTYLGGHVYHVDNAEAARLTAAGYGASVDVTQWSELHGVWSDYEIYPWNEL